MVGATLVGDRRVVFSTVRLPDGTRTSSTVWRHLRVSPSKIPGAGLGLFTTRFCPKGTLIGYYTGRVTKTCEEENLYITEIEDSDGSPMFIDARDPRSCIVRFINDQKDDPELNNCEQFSVEGEEGYPFTRVETLMDVPAGSELYMSYGTSYWESLGIPCKTL